MTAPQAAPPVSEVLRVLRRSHERLVSVVAGIIDSDVEAPSYDTDWTIAQVASHLGSGAEVFALFLDAGTTGSPAPGVQQFQPIWDRWNNKSPLEQVRELPGADGSLLDKADAMSDAEQTAWTLDMFGTTQTLPGLLRMRLAEQALHTWDIEVARDSTVTVPADAAGLILDNLAFLVDRVAKGAPAPVDVYVTTSDPTRQLLLALSDNGGALTTAGTTSETGSELHLPAEAFVRLVYGRLDADHTPDSVVADRQLLDMLRVAFPGV